MSEFTSFAALRRALPWGILAAACVLPRLPAAWPAAVVPALSPYAAAGAALAALASGTRPPLVLLAAAPALALALAIRRGFCRYACPLGAVLGLTARLRRRRNGSAGRIPNIGPWLAAATLGGACAGYPLFLWMDPLAVLSAFVNAWGSPAGIVAAAAGCGLPAALLLDVAFPGAWCGRLCPLGAAQDIVASLLRRGRGRSGVDGQPSGPGRRVFLAAAGGGIAGWALARPAAAAPAILRPPGAARGRRFAALCIRCGNCARNCPARVIHPAPPRAGLTALLSPHLCFDDDYCREDCVRCGRACPTGAIAPLPLHAKRAHAIGLAAVDLVACLLANGRECTRCIAACPYGALTAVSTDGGFSVEPHLDAARCNGCGACEAACPVRPVRAIRVTAGPAPA